MVGTLPGTDAYFRGGRSGGIEAHFGVGGPWEGVQYDGVVYQWRDTEEQADANYHANDFAVSIETSDGGQAERSWTTRQVRALVELGRWLRDTHAIPPRICRTPTDSGFGWHAMWGAPSAWTPARGKTCPGATRIAQLKAEVLPAIIADQAKEEPDVTEEQARQLKAIHDALTVPGTTSPEQTVNLLFDRVRTIEARTVEITDKLDGLTAGGSGGAVDLDALAERVADKLAARLAE
jgi:N-acetylmuramoyl-L-alanine amidase-like protein